MKMKKVLALGLACLTIAGISAPTFANTKYVNQIGKDNMPRENTIVMSKDSLNDFFNAFSRGNDGTSYMTYNKFKSFDNSIEARSCNHSWSSSARDAGEDIVYFTDSKNSYCYEVESLWEQDCTKKCGSVRMFTVFEKTEDHRWSGNTCKNYITAMDRCRARK